jgi:CubicO group peptidase (beta-lactamase class C family)
MTLKSFAQTRTRVRLVEISLAILAAALLLAGRPAAAARPVAAQAGGDADNLPPVGIDAADLEAFLDAFLEEQMAELDVPGAVFVMVKDGEIAFAKGYGFADREREIPWNPARTIVRAGSIVKTVTATALMQLAKEGRIDLDADINLYLSALQVPQTYPEPVTAHV